MRKYLSFTKQVYSERGASGVWNEGTSFAIDVLLRRLNPVLDRESEYVLDKEWDVLLILDGCRVDVLEEVADEYEFLPEPPFDTIWSAESYSEGWLKANFTGEQADLHSERMQNLTHITGNPFTEMFDGDEFAELDEVWEYGWDAEQGYMPPDGLTKNAIESYRDNPDGEMLVHYMQPHAPFVGESSTKYTLTLDKFNNTEKMLESRTPWDLYRDSVISREQLWNAYLDTLRLGLNSVEYLLSEIDDEKTVILSADHGNAMGEWGVYGHPPSVPVPSVREVPWVKADLSAVGEKDESELEEVSEFDEDEEVAREEQLESLGYM